MNRILTIASSNPEKQANINRVAQKYQIITFLASNIRPDLPEINEKEESYFKNALLKASTVNKHVNLPCIADDYGMEIKGLDWEPGIRTHRWVHPCMSDDELLLFTINKIQNLTLEERFCNFIGVGVIVLNAREKIVVEEYDSGILLTSPKGPIISGHPLSSLLFIPNEGKTLAELKANEYSSKDIRIYNRLMKEYLRYHH